MTIASSSASAFTSSSWFRIGTPASRPHISTKRLFQNITS